MKLRNTLAGAMASLSLVIINLPVLACSRVLVRTAHGESVIRTLDWYKKLGAFARVHPVGLERMTRPVPEYNNPAEWTTKYQTVALEEHEVFHGTAAEAINDQGLASSILYLSDSAPFTSQYQDTGAPAVNMADIVTYIAENYSTVREVMESFHAGEFQLAWDSELPQAGRHGLHVSVQDKSGDVMLIQLNEGGEVVVHHGDEDLRVMANAPLQQYHREYVSLFDLDSIVAANEIPSSISSLDRNLRLIWNFSNQKSWEGLNWPQTQAKLTSTFDAGALVPQEVLDPVTGETYTTWIQWIYNLDNGSVKVREFDTYTDIAFNMADIASFEQPMCADLAAQAADYVRPVWEECTD